MLKYKINCIYYLKRKGFNTSYLRKNKIFGEKTIQKMREDKMIGHIELEKLCKLLELQPGDIIEYVEDEKED